jgi:hypothetical protein
MKVEEREYNQDELNVAISMLKQVAKNIDGTLHKHGMGRCMCKRSHDNGWGCRNIQKRLRERAKTMHNAVKELERWIEGGK